MLLFGSFFLVPVFGNGLSDGPTLTNSQQEEVEVTPTAQTEVFESKVAETVIEASGGAQPPDQTITNESDVPNLETSAE